MGTPSVPDAAAVGNVKAAGAARQKSSSRPLTIGAAAVSKDKPEKPYEVRADSPVGLLLRVQPSGSRTFYVQVARGKRVRLGAAGVYTLKRAQAEATKLLADPSTAKTRKASGTTLLEYLNGDYKEYALAHLKNGEGSLARVKAAWKPFLNERLSDITESDVGKYRTKRLRAGLSRATVNRDVAALSGVFTHWVSQNKGAQHPLAGFEPLKVADDETVRYLTPDESTRLRKALADRDAAKAKARENANKWRRQRGYEPKPEITGNSDHMTPMVLLSLNTGLRRGELFSLAWEHVDLERKNISVLASHSKGNATRTIPLNSEALAVLTAIKPTPAKGLVFKSPDGGGRFDNVKKAWAEITKAAGIPDLRWHDLRHDFASQLVMRGVPLFTVQKLLGHQNPKMTQRYAKLAPSTLADAVNLLRGYEG